MEKKLEVKNLQVSFRTQGGIVKAVRNITFDLYKGETLAIVGESGSGKSVTSKAIIGILAGNSIVEGGEILYDGKDLLKISEDDFHKIRGDKISMIFQDPLSSLNPIVKVGKQLTEAMILNGKLRQKSSKKDFNGKLSLLNKSLDLTNNDVENNKKVCQTFDKFCIEGTKLEQAYNEAYDAAISLKSESENFAFLISKNQKVEIKKVLKLVKSNLPKTINPFIVRVDDEYLACQSKLAELCQSGKNANPNDVKALLENVCKILEKGLAKQKPNYFRLGYYILMNPEFDYTSMPVDKLDELTKKYLDENFMLDFIELGSQGVLYSHKEAIKHKGKLVSDLENLLAIIDKEGDLDIPAIKNTLGIIKNKLKLAINFLDPIKKSVEYSFVTSFTHEVKRFAHGKKANPKATKKYERNLAKYNALCEKGKTPTWKVVPPTLVDLDLCKNNMRIIVNSLIKSINKDVANADKFDAKKEMINLVDYLKELASNVVYKVTHKLAKVRALELLKEVGIPEPAIRYNQYPFEFSGGMRQRIVIAIALSANPDILICDEPTTALDVTIQSQILELINKIKAERNLSVIFITHDLGVVANMADRIAVMYAGKIVEYGTSEDIFYDPKHPYTWALLSSMPDLDTKEKLEAIPGTPPNMIYPPKGDAFADRNKYALEIDFEMEPPLFEVSPTHKAATWLLHPDAPKVNPPKIITDRIKRMKKQGGE